MSDEKTIGQVIQIDEARIRNLLGEKVRRTVEETLNGYEVARRSGWRRRRDQLGLLTYLAALSPLGTAFVMLASLG